MSVWDFGDGTMVTNSPSMAHTWNTPGTYEVTLTAWNAQHPQGVSATRTVKVFGGSVLYVWQDSSRPGANDFGETHRSWKHAAHNI